MQSRIPVRNQNYLDCIRRILKFNAGGDVITVLCVAEITKGDGIFVENNDAAGTGART